MSDTEFLSLKKEQLWKFKKQKTDWADWDYLALDAHINECKGDSEKLDKLTEYLHHGYFFNFNIETVFEQIEDDQKVYEVLKNLTSISEKVNKKLGQLKRKDIPLLRKNPTIINHDYWISYLYAQKVLDIDGLLYVDVWARVIFSDDIVFPWDKKKPLKNRLFILLKEWRQNPPDQRVLSELKEMLNRVGQFLDTTNAGRKLKIPTTILQTTLHEIQEDPDLIPIEFVHLLIHFGAEFEGMDEWMLHISRTSIIKARKMMEISSEFEKIFFGMKINRWATRLMDDSVDFSPMRARINLSNTLGILKSREEMEEEKEE